MTFIIERARSSEGIEDEVIRAWTQFDLSEYAEEVFPKLRWSGRLTVTDAALLPYVGSLHGLTELTVPGNVLRAARTEFNPPNSLRLLKVAGSGQQTLDNISNWEGLTHLELKSERVGPMLKTIQRFKNLRGVRLISRLDERLDLGPLTKIPALQEIQLALSPGTTVRVNSVAEKKGLTVFALPRTRILGAEALKDRNQIVLVEELPPLL
jgi:hypothetical protein